MKKDGRDRPPVPLGIDTRSKGEELRMSCSTASLAVTKELELPPEAVIFGVSAAMDAIRRQVENAANANVPVLLGGQSGTGKEVLAKLIHRHSPWRTGAFVKVNCPAIPGTLLESELFGYERGAFTGAYASKPGRVETAEGGTLFLDEIAELEPALQAKLLQLLQDGRFCRIGGHQERQVQVRAVCATNHDLAADVEAGLFRRDLFYRINVLTIQLPPLTERREDLPMLARYLVEKFSAKYNRLENVVKRYVLLGSEEALGNGRALGRGNGHNNGNGHVRQDRMAPAAANGTSLKTVVRQAVKELERDMILRALETNHWNRRLVARSLGISYAALLYKMREAGVPPMRGPRAAKFPEEFDLSRVRKQ
jgi:two-component system response regulator AtoC